MVWKRDKVTAILGQEPKEKRMWFKELKNCFLADCQSHLKVRWDKNVTPRYFALSVHEMKLPLTEIGEQTFLYLLPIRKQHDFEKIIM